MDYEKAYKESLKKAKQQLYIAECNKDEGKVWSLKYMFPELRESEDERIKKSLLALLKELVELGGVAQDTWSLKDCQQYISWLEKQKVNPFSGTSFEYNGDAWGMCARDSGVDVLLNGTIVSHIDKNKKQEWSEEDEKMLNNIFDHLREYYITKKGYPYVAEPNSQEAKESNWLKSLKPQPNQEWSEEDENNTVDRLISIAEILEMDGDCDFNGYTGTDCGKFLRELAIKEVKGKPVEWNEEDEKMLSKLIDVLNGGMTITPTKTYIDWLKSLKNRVLPQPNQEWSEEDDKILQSLHNALNCASAQYAIKSAGVDIEDATEWLFNCKERMCHHYHWKPSDEQMKILKFIIDFHSFQKTVGILTSEQLETIKSLYNDLQKL